MEDLTRFGLETLEKDLKQKQERLIIRQKEYAEHLLKNIMEMAIISHVMHVEFGWLDKNMAAGYSYL